MQRPNFILSFYLCVAVITLTRTQPLTQALLALFCRCVSLYLHALLAAGKVLCVRSAAQIPSGLFWSVCQDKAEGQVNTKLFTVMWPANGWADARRAAYK